MISNIEQYLFFPFDDATSSITQEYSKIEIPTILLSLNQNNSIDFYEDRNTFTVFGKNIESANTQKQNVIIICIKDNPILLDFCLKQIRLNDIDQYCDVIVIDDRPSNTDNEQIVQKYGYMYIRIINTSNIFNYSVLNNIGATYANKLSKKRLIFWNSDLWAENKNTLPNLLKKHINYNSAISGTKLVYPSQEYYNEIFPDKQHVLGKKLQSSYNTIQHGGIVYVSLKSHIYPKPLLHPIHQWRFYDRYHSLANIDTRCFAVTGALQIINTKDFLYLKGYCCSLYTAYQDIDLCQKAVKENIKVYYLGSEEMFHAETITNIDGQNNRQSSLWASDRLLYDYLWCNKLSNILGFNK